MKRLGLLLIIFTFICPVLQAEEVALTLDEAIQIALRDNRDMLLKAEEVKKAKLKISEAQAGLYPTLTFTGGWKDTRDYYPKKNLGQTSTQFTVKQYLYRGGKTINSIAQNQDKLVVAQTLLDKTKIELILNVQKAFNLSLLAEKFAELNKQILNNALMHLEVVKVKFQNGEVSQSDILRIKESLASVEEAYAASVNQVESTQVLLCNLLYLEEGIRIKPQGKFAYEPKEVAYDEAFLKAMQNRPEIRQYEAQTKADQKAIEIAKADSRPSIYASWDYYSSSTSTATFSPSKAWQDYSIIGFTFSWPIFDGWATKAKVEQAIVDLKETRLTQGKIRKDIALELKNAYLSLKNAIAKIKASASEVALYQDYRSTVGQKYRQGIASTLDLQDGELKYRIALFNRHQALYDYIIARVSFDKATGGIQ